MIPREIRYGWRALWRSPGFALSAILTLALGVGANTAIFSVVNATLLSPLPYRDSDRLVFVWEDQSKEGYARAPLSGPELNDLRERNSRFEGIGAIWATTTALTGEGDPEQLRVGLVSTNFFSLLGADAGLGRTFRDEDDLLTPNTILLSDELWRRRFGGDPQIVGRRIEVNAQPMTVVGVMPRGFRLLLPPDSAVPDDLDAWLPFSRRFTAGPRGQRYLRVIGRMRAEVSLAEAARDIDRVAREISQAYAEYGAAGRLFETVALHADSTREIRRPLLALFAGVGILLTIACVNVASLLVARAAARYRETAVRVALGAGTSRLLSQHLAEGMLLTFLGVAGGLLIGRWGLAALIALSPESLGRLSVATVDVRVVLLSSATAIVWGLLLSIAPLAGALRSDPARALQADGRRSGAPIGQHLRSGLVIVQVALGVVLIVGAGLLMRTFINIQRADPGFRADGIVSFRIALPGARYQTREAFNQFGRQLEAELRALPGVNGVGAISHVPYDSIPNWGGPYLLNPGEDDSRAPQADYRAISAGAIDALSIRVIEGRTFTEDDDQSAEPVVIVDERLARRSWPQQSAIGKRLAVDPSVTGHPNLWATVVGVVRHVRHRSPIEEVREQVYFSERQVQRNPMVYLVRSTADASSLAGPIRNLVSKLDAQLPVYGVRPLPEYVTGVRAIRGFTTMLAGVFAVVALLLAAVGVYGVVAFSVTTRIREFGVRLALGASPGQVRSLVMREGIRLAAAGLALGLGGAAVAAWLLESQLFGVGRWDPISYLVAVPVLGLVALAGSWLPAWRATRANPLGALRSD
jgi:putative ABC transport system permease protein